MRCLSVSFRSVLGCRNFFGANGSLFFIQCPQTRFIVRILKLHLCGDDSGANVIGFCSDNIFDLGRSQL